MQQRELEPTVSIDDRFLVRVGFNFSIAKVPNSAGQFRTRRLRHHLLGRNVNGPSRFSFHELRDKSAPTPLKSSTRAVLERRAYIIVEPELQVSF